MVKSITYDNVRDLDELIDPDVSENIKRVCYKAAIACGQSDASPDAAIVWEHAEDDDGAKVAQIAQLAISEESDEQDKESGAKELLEHFDKCISDDEITQSYFEFDDPDEDIINILREAGFTVSDTESRDLYVTLGDISATSLSGKKPPDYIFEINKLNDIQLWQGITNCMFFGKKGILSDLEDIPEGWFDKDISACVWTDNMANGLFLVHRTTSGILVPVLMFASEPDGNKNVLFLMRFALLAALEKYPPETKVLLRRHNKYVRALTNKLFPGKKGISVTSGIRKKEGISQ